MIHIRTYTNEDYPEVRKTLELVKIFDPERDSQQNLEAKIQRDPESILVALDDGKIIGNVYFLEDGWTSLIFRLAVRKEYRKHGVGSLLMQEAEKILKGRGYSKVSLFVHEDALDHLGPYYKKRGYVAVDHMHQCFTKYL